VYSPGTANDRIRTRSEKERREEKTRRKEEKRRAEKKEAVVSRYEHNGTRERA